MGGPSNCAGTLEIKHKGNLRTVHGWYDGHRVKEEKRLKAVRSSEWNRNASTVVCKQLDCGSAASTQRSYGSKSPAWRFESFCDGSEPSLRKCGKLSPGYLAFSLEVICSGKDNYFLPC